jgi:hypothetical protein
MGSKGEVKGFFSGIAQGILANIVVIVGSVALGSSVVLRVAGFLQQPVPLWVLIALFGVTLIAVPRLASSRFRRSDAVFRPIWFDLAGVQWYFQPAPTATDQGHHMASRGGGPICPRCKGHPVFLSSGEPIGLGDPETVHRRLPVHWECACGTKIDDEVVISSEERGRLGNSLTPEVVFRFIQEKARGEAERVLRQRRYKAAGRVSSRSTP